MLAAKLSAALPRLNFDTDSARPNETQNILFLAERPVAVLTVTQKPMRRYEPSL